MNNISNYIPAPTTTGLKIPAFYEDDDKMYKASVNDIDSGVYDKVIRTQAEFDELIASPTWLGAVSVALVGEFASAVSVTIPEAVKQIHGFNGAKITIGGGDFGYATRPDADKGYEIRNLEVVSTSTGSDGYGFNNCTNLTNCTGTGIGNDSGYGFNYCANLTNCTGTGTGDAYFGYGFNSCINLINCTGTGTSSAYFGYGFYNCTNLTNCTGTGTSSAYSGYGFYNCTNLTNCTGTGTGGAYSGYGFYDCSCCNSCVSGTTPSSTGTWGGVNINIDADTCPEYTA